MFFHRSASELALTHTEDGVTVKVTGWSTSNGTTGFDASRVRRFSTGLGTCASSENTSSRCQSPQHAVDNNGRKEILLLTFSTPLLVIEALISAWADDFDATFWGGTGSINMTATSFATLDTLAAGPTAGKGHDEFIGDPFNGQLRTIPLGAIASPVSWLVFGAQPNESNDHFKFKSLYVHRAAKRHSRTGSAPSPRHRYRASRRSRTQA